MRNLPNGLCAFLLLVLPLDVRAGTLPGRVDGYAAVGAGYDDHVFQDARDMKDRYLILQAGLGWRGRPLRPTQVAAEYRYAGEVYDDMRSESYGMHSLELSVKQRVADRAWLTLGGSGDAYSQFQLKTYDYTRFVFQPGAEVRIWEPTLVAGAVVLGKESYPDYDYDHRLSGVQVRLEQDLGLNGGLSLRYGRLTRDFTQRRLLLDTLGTLSSETRRDREDTADLGLNYNLRPVYLSGGYSWKLVASNAGYLDYGPMQTELTNTTAGDERLIRDYYVSGSQGPSVGARWRILRPLQLAVSDRWERIDFSARLAKDAADNFLPGSRKRRDTRNTFMADLTYTVPLETVSIDLTAGWRWEANDSNDALYDFNRNRYSFTLQIWF